jgi:hypothetical protein
LQQLEDFVGGASEDFGPGFQDFPLGGVGPLVLGAVGGHIFYLLAHQVVSISTLELNVTKFTISRQYADGSPFFVAMARAFIRDIHQKPIDKSA